MKTMAMKLNCAMALVIGGILVAGPVLAAKPEWAGQGKGKGDHAERRDDQRGERRENNRRSEGRRDHFQDQHRVVVRQYYEEQFRGGRCPPGLAKKHNGCMPPGQAKKWQMGRPLPRDVIFYPVPEPLVVQIGVPPSGYRYVRVANDILLIAIGTGMVADAIRDLGR